MSSTCSSILDWDKATDKVHWPPVCTRIEVNALGGEFLSGILLQKLWHAFARPPLIPRWTTPVKYSQCNKETGDSWDHGQHQAKSRRMKILLGKTLR